MDQTFAAIRARPKVYEPFVVAGFHITAFDVSHDAIESIGFYIRKSDSSICFATDLGFINPTAASYLRDSNVLVLESNYDDEMLKNGPYPPLLQKRINSEKGHLSNEQTSNFLAENWNNKLSHVFLAHLSEHNNDPSAAIDKLNQHLSKRGIIPNATIHIEALQRKKRSSLYQI